MSRGTAPRAGCGQDPADLDRRTMLRTALQAGLLALGLAILGLGTSAAPAQPALPAAPAATPGAGAAALPSAAELDALIRELEDPAARAELIAKLRALRAAAGTPTAEPAVPAGVAETALEQASRILVERLEATLRVFGTLAALLGNLPQLGDWLAFQLENPYRRELWRSVASGVAQALGIAALVGWLAARLVRRWRPSAPLGARARLRVAALDLLPVGIFAAVAGLILDQGGFLPAAARVAWLVVGAVLADRALAVAVRHLAEARGLTPLGEPAPADSPASVLRATLRIGRLVIYGNMVLLVAGRLGLPPDLYDAASSLLTILVASALTVAILGRRGAIERAVRALGRWIEADFLRRLLLLDLLIGTAHLWLVALVWLNAAVLVLGLGWGPVRATLATLAVLAAAHLVLTWLDRPTAAGKPEGEEPGEVAPAARKPLTARLLAAAVKLAALVLLLEAWGIGLIGWLTSPEGRAALEKGVRIAAILGIGYGLWRLASWWIGGYIAARDAQGNVRYSNRARTAAAIARSVIVVLLVLIAVVAVLGELGIQATPLLAGAGVVGLAVGFGSQKLVQDIINGLFILLGDTIRVGDVVDLGGRTGVVEAISMRTVTLRSYNGDVHTIPFGTIDSITNMTRDFSFWVLDVGVSYKENVDRVITVLHEIEAQLRREWPWRRLILEPLEIAGLDRFGDSAVVIRGRLKTRPGEQWRVGREFNRRLKRRFDELGIEIPFPQRTVHLVAEPRSAGATAPGPAAGSEPARLAAGRS
ncbi:MAG: mechanosensitive ion channel family protein [Geminicoccaceae bacterium]|nr:mechanosensitive ion channel family protein [Geminicoccaceae bacterium]